MTHFEGELAYLHETYRAALDANITRLESAIAGASQSSLIAVGSGGSYTAASLLCGLHEHYTGHVSRPSTCLELICNPTLALASPVFLISAEGKNPDIVEALKRARHFGSRPLHVLTNSTDSPLLRHVESLGDISAHVHPLGRKDGYLATNSLLLNATLIARCYAQLDQRTPPLPATLDNSRVGDDTVEDWVTGLSQFLDAAATRAGVLVTFSPMLRPLAIDLEAKLSEAALQYCQVADLRSFAHGRHLWLAERPLDCSVICLVEPSLKSLWEKTRLLLPTDVPTLTVPMAGATPADLVFGLAATMHLVSALAKRLGRDPGRPTVPEFGRKIYYLDLEPLVPTPRSEPDPGSQTKADVLGARWPAKSRGLGLQRALDEFKERLATQSFRAVVFDYDGTLCQSSRRDSPPPAAIFQALTRLLESGVIVGVATGRGKSVDEQLRSGLHPSRWTSVSLALYSGGLMTTVGSDTAPEGGVNEFLSHVTRIARRLEDLGVPIETIKATHPYQLSVRFREGIPTESMWFVFADALRQAGLDLSRLECSKHSIDVLAPGLSKASLVAHLVQKNRLDPYEILTVGDQGAWPGNDASLLEHKFSLSVDVPSRRLDRGWKLAPGNKRQVDATLWYLDHLVPDSSGRFRFVL